MNGKDLLSPQNEALPDEHASIIAKLLSPESWEEALAYWVDAFPAEKLIRGLGRVMNDRPEAQEREVIDGIFGWLQDRSDERRWRLFQQAEELGFATPAGALGLVLFWMGGSMTPANCEPVYADRALIPLMLRTACKLMAIKLAADNPPVAGAQLLFSRWLAAEKEA